MNFFDAQERSQRRTRFLIALFAVATLAVAVSVTAIIAGTIWSMTSSRHMLTFPAWLSLNSDTVWIIGIGSIAFICFAALYRTVSLREGGGRVARDLGATRVSPDSQDPKQRQLINVVAEMAIASGVPVPEIYLMENESGINAFAAGFNPEDAVVAVTRGTLDQLSREELQGVVAHEFSHILNGDMQLNIRLMGPLFGILVVGLLGRTLLRNVRFSRGSSRKGGSGIIAVMLAGVGLTVTGYVGLLFARLIKAGVSRQREYLADASAVQFTRQSSGIAGALKKIAGYPMHSKIDRSDGEEVSHMLFAAGSASFAQLLATHPPILERIQSLEPGFKAESLPRFETAPGEPSAGDSALSPLAPETFRSATAAPIVTDADSLAATIGNPDEHHIRAAETLHRAITPKLQRALEVGDQSLLLILALILHDDERTRLEQLSYLSQKIGERRAEIIAGLYVDVALLGPVIRLPLLDLAFPSIKERPEAQMQFVGELMRDLTAIDGRTELFEYALMRVFGAHLRRAYAPGRRPRKYLGLQQRKTSRAAAMIFTILARHGHDNDKEATDALNRGLATIDVPPVDSAALADTLADGWMDRLDNALQLLQDCTPRSKKAVVNGMMRTAISDGQISSAESQLLRVVCAILGCPLPPVIRAQRSN